MENPSYIEEDRDHLDAQQRPPKPGFSSVEQRPGIHSVGAVSPMENSHQKSKLYPYLEKSSGGTPSTKQAVSDEIPNQQTYIPVIIAILVVLVAVIMGLFLFVHVRSPDKQEITREEEKETPLDRLRQRLQSLKALFSGQTGRLWTVSLAAIRPLLERPKHPAVILLAGSKQITATTDCVALKMSEVVKDALDAESRVVVFDCRKYKDWEPQAVKREMDRQLTEAFERGAKVGVVLALESLPGASPMIFYRFCDTANAPFKNVVLILTLNMEKEATSDRDSEAHEELGRLWNSVLEPEQVDPLFSRIGNSVAYVREETDLSHCKKEN